MLHFAVNSQKQFTLRFQTSLFLSKFDINLLVVFLNWRLTKSVKMWSYFGGSKLSGTKMIRKWLLRLGGKFSGKAT